MKKPDIDMQSKRMMIETKAYSEMIDALIAAKEDLNQIATEFDFPEELHDGETYQKIEQALKAAGCVE